MTASKGAGEEMGQWNYIDKMNNFISHELENLTPSEAVLYLRLFKLNNDSTPPRAEWFTVKNIELVALMGKDTKEVRRLKKSLMEKGLIDYKPGKKGNPTEYRLLPVEGELKGGKKTGGKIPPKKGKGGKTPPENAPENAPLNAPQKVPEGLISCGVAGGNKEQRTKYKVLRDKRESREKEKSCRFSPPSLDEIKAYIHEKGLPVDPAAFFDYYEAGNWQDSRGQKVKNWKQKALTWARHEKPVPKKNTLSKESSFQHEIDWSVYDGQ